MKRILAILLLCAALSFCLFGCSEPTDGGDSTAAQTEKVEPLDLWSININDYVSLCQSALYNPNEIYGAF